MQAMEPQSLEALMTALILQCWEDGTYWCRTYPLIHGPFICVIRVPTELLAAVCLAQQRLDIATAVQPPATPANVLLGSFWLVHFGLS